MRSLLRRGLWAVLPATACLTIGASAARAATLTVGPGRMYAVPSEAAAVAADGDVIEIAAGEYRGDVAVWRANGLTIRGVGGMAHLEADGAAAQGKGIWVIQGDGTTVENIEFSGATVPDQNGAGIRQEGAGLTVRYCSFHDNEDGILAGDNADSDIVIEYTEFANNGFGDGQSHNLYINHVRSLVFRFNWSHHARIGHLFKSRALRNLIAYNMFADEADGTASYEIDLPNGGDSYVIGNVIHQGPATDNSTILSFAAEGASNPVQALYVVNNTFVNDRGSGTFVRNSSDEPCHLINNLFVGGGTVLDGPGDQTTNLEPDASGFVGAAAYDYHLVAGAPAIDVGSDPGSAGAMSLSPDMEYVHPRSSAPRTSVGMALDVGAFEFGTAVAVDAGMPGTDAGPVVGDDGGVPIDGGAGVDAGGQAVDAGGVRDGGGTAADGATAAGDDDSGCGCRVLGRRGVSGVNLTALAAFAALLVARRSRERVRRRRR